MQQTWTIIACDKNGNWYEFTRKVDYSSRIDPVDKFENDVREALDNPGAVAAVYRKKDVVFSGKFDEYKEGFIHE